MGARNSHEDFDGDNPERMEEDDNAPNEAAPAEEAARPALEPRRHQGGQRAVDILSALDYLYRTGQLRLMPRHRSNRRHSVEQDIDAPNTPHVAADTSVMDGSDFKQKVLVQSGLLDVHPSDVPSGLLPLWSVREFRPFRPSEKAQLVQSKLPNTSTKLLEIDDKLFCGLHSQDGSVLLTAGQDQRIRIFDTSRSHTVRGAFKPIRSIVARDVGWSVLDVRLSTCGRYVAYSSWSDSIHLATVHDDATHVPVPLNPDQPNTCGVFSLMFSHDDTEILSGVNHGELYICSLLNGRSQSIHAHQDDVNCVAFADQSSQILYSGSDDGIIKVWDRRNLSENRPRPCGIFVGHKHGITYLDPHFDGRHVLSNGKDQCVKLWDLRVFSPAQGLEEAKKAVNENSWDYRYRSRRPLCTRKLHNDTSIMTYTGHIVSQTLIRARFSPYETTASRYIVTGDAAGSVYVFDSLTGEIVHRLAAHSGVVRDVSWHPSRPEIISTGWDGCQMLWTYNCDDGGDVESDQDETMREDDNETSSDESV